MALRITVEENAEAVVLKLEGRLTGPWVAELDRLWAQMSATLGARKVTLDVRETTFADTNGIAALRIIYRKTGADFLTSSPWTQYLSEEIERNDGEHNQEV